MVEQTHDDGFTLGGRDSGNAKVERFAADLTLDATVLGNALLVDAHGLGHDLQTADDGTLQCLGKELVLLQLAVDAETHAKAGFERFQVDIAGPHFLRLFEEVLHQFDDAGIIVAGRAPGFLLRPGGDQTGLPRVDVGQQGLDALRIGVEKLDLGFEQEWHGVERLEVHGVTDGYLQTVIGLLERQDAVAPRHFPGDQPVQLAGALGGIGLVEVRKTQAVEVGDRPVDVARLHRPGLEQRINDGRARMPFVGITDLLLRDPELVEEDFENLFVGVHGGGSEQIVYGC